MRWHLWSLARTRQRLILLVIGALLLIIGIALRSATAFIIGLLLMGSFAFDAQQGSPTSAHVRMWQSQRKDKASHL
jgi:hypothetical protein